MLSQVMDCTAAILCGGKSTRMGCDKALIKIDEEYVVLKTVTCLKKMFANVVLVTDHQKKFPAAFSQTTILEDHYQAKGPLGGLVTILEQMNTTSVFLLACDIPEVNSQLIEKMAQYKNSYEIVICQQKNRLEPLFAFYDEACRAVFRQQLESNDWRIRKEFHRFTVKIIELDATFPMENVNTPKELALWQSDRVKKGV